MKTIVFAKCIGLMILCLELLFSFGQVQPAGAALYSRPALSSSALMLDPFPNYGVFIKPGGIARFKINIEYFSYASSEVYDLKFDCDWPLTITDGDTGSLLTDTDGSGWPNTGSVTRGPAKTIFVSLHSFAVGNVGDYVRCDFWVSPMSDSTLARYSRLDAAIPANYASTHKEWSNNLVTLTIIEPSSQTRFPEVGRDGDTPAVVEAPNGNLVYAWAQDQDIFFAIRDRSGGTVKEPTVVEDNHPGYDYHPAVAVAPDGSIGITWYRYETYWRYDALYNIHFALFNQAGNLKQPVVSVTNNTIISGVFIKYPVIAATSDNRFVLAWEHTNTHMGLADINLVVYSTAGAQVKALTNLTNDTAGDNDGCYSPRVAAVGSQRVIILYSHSLGPDIYFQVLDSAGSVIRTATDLSNDDALNSESSPDVANLSDGNILVAWISDEINYVVLNSDFNQVSSKQSLDGTGSTLSVTASTAGYGVILAESSNYTLYSLVSSSAQTITPPIISSNPLTLYSLNSTGGSITSHRIMTPVTPNTDLYLDGPMFGPVIANAPVEIQVNLGNLGAAAASTITVTLTKPNDVSLVSYIPTPNCLGNTCTWTFNDPSLAFLGSGMLSFQASVPPSSNGMKYPLQMHISSPEIDDVPGNNDLTIWLAMASQSYLPVMMK